MLLLIVIVYMSLLIEIVYVSLLIVIMYMSLLIEISVQIINSGHVTSDSVIVNVDKNSIHLIQITHHYFMCICYIFKIISNQAKQLICNPSIVALSE